jgi:hypothetical protein
VQSAQTPPSWPQVTVFEIDTHELVKSTHVVQQTPLLHLPVPPPPPQICPSLAGIAVQVPFGHVALWHSGAPHDVHAPPPVPHTVGLVPG